MLEYVERSLACVACILSNFEYLKTLSSTTLTDRLRWNKTRRMRTRRIKIRVRIETRVSL